MIFFRAEKICAAVIAALFLSDAILIPIRGVGIDWPRYALMAILGAVLVAVGQFYRIWRPDEKIALATTATGLFSLFTLVGSIFNYLILPVGDRRIDPLLMRMDAFLGYSWSGFVESFASMPTLGRVLGWVYMSSLGQLLVIILVLGFSNQKMRLHQFLLTGIIGILIALTIWGIFPSSGPAAFETISPEIANSLHLVVGPSYGAELNRLAFEGTSFISPTDALGLIAFPSFHTVMACMAVWSMLKVKQVRPVFIVLNIFMIPAILIHGGHHLVDVIGGFAVFGISLALSRALVFATASPVPADGATATI